ncbi:hypothetical protein BT69DRAFT_1350687 [Atractiella rhizophila]|nr:hypothetical protein BT69DRAFT_1350687 [Atractiella rhizophila]
MGDVDSEFPTSRINTGASGQSTQHINSNSSMRAGPNALAAAQITTAVKSKYAPRLGHTKGNRTAFGCGLEDDDLHRAVSITTSLTQHLEDPLETQIIPTQIDNTAGTQTQSSSGSLSSSFKRKAIDSATDQLPLKKPRVSFAQTTLYVP